MIEGDGFAGKANELFEGGFSVAESTLGLAGDGDLFFDDLRVERLTENAPLNKDRVAIRDGQPATGGVPEPGVPVAAPAESVVPDNRP